MLFVFYHFTYSSPYKGVLPNCFYYFSTMGVTEAEHLSVLNEKSLVKIKDSWDLLLLQIRSKSLDEKGYRI